MSATATIIEEAIVDFRIEEKFQKIFPDPPLFKETSRYLMARLPLERPRRGRSAHAPSRR